MSLKFWEQVYFGNVVPNKRKCKPNHCESQDLENKFFLIVACHCLYTVINDAIACDYPIFITIPIDNAIERKNIY